MTPIRMSVILPVYNGGPFLQEQLEAVTDQVATFPWELIVVDNASTDASAAVARSFADRFPNVRVLSEPRRGKSNALNAGIAAAQGEYLLFLDADDVAAPGYLEAMAAGLDRFEMVSGRADLVRLNPEWARGGGWRTDDLSTTLDWLTFVPGGMLGLRADARRRIGDFSPEFVVGEDCDFTWRATLCGVTTGFVPDAVMHVRRTLSARQTFRKGRAYGRAGVQLFVTYRDRGQPRRRPRAVARHIWETVGPFVTGQDHGWWYLALEGGVLCGRATECLRRHVVYP